MDFNTDSTKISCRPFASPLFVFSVDSKDAATTMVIRRKDGGRFPKRPCSFTKKTAVFFLGDRRLNASTACGNPSSLFPIVSFAANPPRSWQVGYIPSISQNSTGVMTIADWG